MPTRRTMSFPSRFDLAHIVFIIELLLFHSVEGCLKSNVQRCALSTGQLTPSYSRDGDILLGGILQISLVTGGDEPDFLNVPDSIVCVGPTFRYLRHFLAFIYAIEEINKSTEILPNITLGFQIYDACTSEVIALMSTLNIISEKKQAIPNYSCQSQQKMVAFIGHISSSTSYTMAEITQLYGYAQISYGAMNPVFNDRIHFPYIFRTVSDDYSQIKVIIQLLLHFGWSWVGIVASNDDSNQQASEKLKRELEKNKICVDFLAIISQIPVYTSTSIQKVIKVIKHSTVNVIILYCSTGAFIGLLEVRIGRLTAQKVWISSVSLNIITDYNFYDYFNAFNGSLSITIHQRQIDGFKEVLYQPAWYNMSDNVFISNFWRYNFECTNGSQYTFITTHCSMEERWHECLSQEESNAYQFTYTAYIAVYTLAHALHNMHLAASLLEQLTEEPAAKFRFKLNHYLKNVHFKTKSGEEIFFNEKGYIPGNFDVQNWVIYTNGTIKKSIVGSFSSTSDQRIPIKDNDIIWGPRFNQTPNSLCTPTCPLGHRKAPLIGKPSCCFDCLPCSEGEFANSTDMENCIMCPEDQWSNPSKDQCIKRTIDFLSYDDVLGTTLSCFASVFLLITTAVLWIFIKYGDTAIVKVNNRKLSYILLSSLMGSYTCSFLFIGQPKEYTCLLRHVTVGFIFTVAISSILGKTVTVVIAFNATKPGSRLKKWVGSKVSIGLVLVCSLSQLVICATWLICSPPFVDIDTKSSIGTIILQCNDGSFTAFYLAIAYIAVLAIFSFCVAFTVRKLPDTFNEAKYITFSMLVFCSVWISFVPTYLSTKGKYMVGVEIFSILASTSGILICIFAPKCYIILLKPELNIKSQLYTKAKHNKIKY